MRHQHAAAVGDGGHGHRHLHGRHQEVPLADGQVDLVPDPPDLVLVGLAGVGLPVLVGHPAALGLPGQIDAGLLAEAELPHPVLQNRAGLRIEQAAQVVEVDVAGLLDGLQEIRLAVAVGVRPVLPGLLVGGELAHAIEGRLGRDQAGAQGRGGHEGLEGGTGRVEAVDGPVEQGEVGLSGVQLRVLRLGHAAHPQRGVVVRVRGQRQDLAGVGVHGHHGATRGVVERGVSVMSQLDPLDQGILRGRLEIAADGEPQVAPGRRREVLDHPLGLARRRSPPRSSSRRCPAACRHTCVPRRPCPRSRRPCRVENCSWSRSFWEASPT